MKRAFLAFVCVLAVASFASAGDIYNNLNSNTDGFDPISSAPNPAGYGPLGDSFSTGAGGFTLAELLVKVIGTPDAGGFTATLYSDSGGSGPMTALSVLGTEPDSALTGSYQIVHFILDMPYALDANTRYWIVLSGVPATDTSANWTWSLDQGAPGVAGEFFWNQNGLFSNIGGPYQMRLSDTVVPEPGTLLLLGSGLSGLLLRFRRKSRA